MSQQIELSPNPVDNSQKSRSILSIHEVKTQEIALTMLLGIGGVGVGIVGVLGFFKIGALSNLKQLHAIIMMGAGGGGGVALLILSIICIVKKEEEPSNTAHSKTLKERLFCLCC